MKDSKRYVGAESLWILEGERKIKKRSLWLIRAVILVLGVAAIARSLAASPDPNAARLAGSVTGGIFGIGLIYYIAVRFAATDSFDNPGKIEAEPVENGTEESDSIRGGGWELVFLPADRSVSKKQLRATQIGCALLWIIILGNLAVYTPGSALDATAAPVLTALGLSAPFAIYATILFILSDG